MSSHKLQTDELLTTPPLLSVVEELRRCGWGDAPLASLGDTIHFQTFQGGHQAACLRLAGADRRHLLVISLDAVQLPSTEDLFPRFLDLALEVRMALTLARRAGQAQWLLLRTADRIDLYRIDDEACLGRTANREQFDRELLPLLTALGRGREGTGRTAHPGLPAAESLGEWIKHWSMQLGASLEIYPHSASQLLWKWILMLQLTRKIETSEADRDWGLQCRFDAGRWSIAYNALSATEDLARLLERFNDCFSSWQFESNIQPILRKLHQFDETSLIDRLRAELLMHSQNRFEPETVAWLYTDIEAEQAGWRREITGLEPLNRRFLHDGWSVYRPLVCDVGQFGLTAALSDAERLAIHLNELDLYLRQQAGAREPIMSQDDLFCQNPRGIGPGGQLDDGLNYLFTEALRLQGAEPARRLGITATFLLKAIQLADRLQWPFLGIDSVDRIFSESDGEPTKH